ncbi:hypothetical protein CHS0354_027916 [Potamilus streckersoni]|uniref:Uncharacterized protein n=1 Tax=Potamilus streckersoni TaxID=2493646 RepID=A0AAE0T3I9_9BIVA|nr:hypothetical protein CHS0354_027916 [Potamilus streckersoni]
MGTSLVFVKGVKWGSNQRDHRERSHTVDSACTNDNAQISVRAQVTNKTNKNGRTYTVHRTPTFDKDLASVGAPTIQTSNTVDSVDGTKMFDESIYLDGSENVERTFPHSTERSHTQAMERAATFTSLVLVLSPSEEERRIALVMARKDEEKKKEGTKVAIMKVREIIDPLKHS